MISRATGKFNTLFGRISGLVLLGLVLTGAAVSLVVLSMSQRIFTDTYGESQEKVFVRIENEMGDFHENLVNMMNAIDSSWAFRIFLDSEEYMDNIQRFLNIYQMEADLEDSKTTDMERLNILVLGKNGRNYLSRTETISMPDDLIWESEPVKRAVSEPELVHYEYSHGAYTATSKDRDVVIISKALYYQETGDIYAVVLVTMTQEDMKNFYDYFVTEYSSFYMVDENGVVLCSDVEGDIGKKPSYRWYEEAEASDNARLISGEYTVLKRSLTYQGCTIYGVIDNGKALAGLYDMSLIIATCAVISVLVLLAVLLLTRHATLPLARLSDKMSAVRAGDFMEYMPVEGSNEVRELAITYNYMLDDLKKYIDELLETQQDKRAAEIKALQMQINPHYIYNTLASIKWMVYANDREKTIKMIDAFISLLRNTISNADEFITIDQEVENLKNYILINQIRYGETVRVEFHVQDSCLDCLLPKMILQPFVENAFFHAFPSGRRGQIDIFMEEIKDTDTLRVRIADDGIGMEQSVADIVVERETKKEHFSGIGIHNVKDRLALLYGERAGVNIESNTGNGTVVTVELPAKRADKGNSGGISE
ncbi:MAG: sensor histidine kinase [Lachnospiraceae bacterium]|nr:sensor histidine kinase [Lachnospiraceae bacterium]